MFAERLAYLPMVAPLALLGLLLSAHVATRMLAPGADGTLLPLAVLIGYGLLGAVDGYVEQPQAVPFTQELAVCGLPETERMARRGNERLAVAAATSDPGHGR